MARIFKQKYSVRLPKRKADSEEFGPGKAGVILCKDCEAVYHKKRWHHGINDIKTKEKNKILPVKFGPCPACSMIKNHQYEGRITIKGLPKQFEGRLKELTEGFSRRAYLRDPMDKVIDVKKQVTSSKGHEGSKWVITTTENQLANKLAQKIKNFFSKAKSKTKFAGSPSDVAEITIEFS